MRIMRPFSVLIGIAAAIVTLTTLSLPATAKAIGIGESGHYSFTGSDCAQGGRVDPVGVLFVGPHANARNVAAQVSRQAGWEQELFHGTQWLWVHTGNGNYSCNGTNFQQATQPDFPPGKRYHVRLWFIPATKDSKPRKTVGTPHHEDLTECEGLIPDVGHSVDSNGPEGSGFDQGRKQLARRFFAHGRPVIEEKWGNSEDFPQCDGDWAGSNGLGAAVTIQTYLNPFTGMPRAVTSTQEALDGTFTPDETSVDWWFSYGPKSAQGSSGYPFQTAVQSSLTGTTAAVDVSKLVTGLTPNATYYVRMFARNQDGEVEEGNEQTFTVQRDEDDASPGPRVIVDREGALHIFYRDTNGDLGHQWLVKGSETWSGEVRPVSSSMEGDPRVVIDTSGVFHVFYRETSGNLGHQWIAPGASSWGEEVRPVNSMAGDPRVIVDPDGALHVFYRDSNGDLGHQWLVKGSETWSGETRPVNSMAGDPYLLYDTSGVFHVFYRETSGNLGHQWIARGAPFWGEEVRPVNSMAGDPRVIVDPDGALHVFYRDSNGNLGHQWLVKGSENWSGETRPVNSMASDPRVLYDKDSALHIFYAETSGNIGHQWINYGASWWGEEVRPVSSIGSAPKPIIDATNVFHLFYRQTDGNMGHQWIPPGGGAWSGVVHPVNSMTSGPVPLVDTSKVLHAFYRETNGSIGHQWLASGSETWGGEVRSVNSMAGRPPLATTGGTTGLDEDSVTVKGSVVPEGSMTSYYFEYGSTTSYGSKQPASAKSVGDGSGAFAVSEALNGLSPSTTYHYRLVATNGEGTTKGNDATFTTNKWQVREAPSFEKSVDLEDVSCVNKNTCTAVGVHEHPQVTVALRGENGVWTQQPTPNPSGSTHNKLEGVSCPTVSFCAAVGRFNVGGTKPLAERWSDSGWALDTPPLPASGGPAELLSVSCISVSYCVAVGQSGFYPSMKTLIEVWNGTGWSVVSSPSPGTGSELRSVSCVSTSSCVAVGTTDNNSVLIERWNGSSWSVESTSVQGGSNTVLQDVSCTSATFCMAVGRRNGSNHLALAWDGSKWSEVNPTETPSATGGVSCSSGTSCYALGGKGAVNWDGSKWTSEPMASIGGSLPSMRDISCWSAASCVSVGTIFNAVQNKRLPVVEQRSPHSSPTASTGAVSGLALNGKATLHGTVEQAGIDASYYFEYGTTTSYGSKAPAVAKEIVSGKPEVEVSQAIESLPQNTTYHYRLVALNDAGTSKGEDRTFTTLDTMPIKALSFGSLGAGNGQLAFPRGIAVEADGELWVVDADNHRVQKFSESGEYLTQFGSHGTGNGQFDTPVDIAITASGDLWVTDAYNCRVQKFDSTGKYLDQFGGCGLGNGEFVEPSGIAIAPNGHIWVTDFGYSRVKEFTASGDFVRSAYNQGSPTGIVVDSNGHVWVSDSELDRVQELDANGNYLSQFGSHGTGTGQFAGAASLDVTPSGRIWVTDRETGRVQAFNASGHYLGTFGNFFEPGGLAAASDGSVYVSDSRNDRVQKWRLAAAPNATTLAAQEVASNQAKLRGTVDAAGFATTYRFEYGKTTAYGASVPVPDGSVAASGKAVEVSQTASSLTPGTTYHYRIVANSDGGGPVYGADQTFETPPTPLQLAAMATTKAFDGSTASLADFAANWSKLGWAWGSAPKGADTSTGWRPVALAAVNGTYFNPTIADTGPGIAALATLSAKPGVNGGYFSLWLDMPSPGAATRDGYELRFTETATAIYEVALSRWQAGTQITLATKTDFSFAVGSQFALIDKGGTVSAWTKTGSEFTQLLSAEDSTFSAGNVGLEGWINNTRLTNFKTGSLLNPVANMDAALKGLPMIDTFNRSEAPLSNGGSWAAVSWANGSSGKNTGQTFGAFGWVAYDAYPTINGAHWTKASMPDTGAGVGVAATLFYRSFVAAGRYFSLWLDMPSPGSARTGYELRFTETSSAVYDVTLSKWQAGAQTLLATKTGCSFAAGNQLALVDKGGTVSAWTKTGTEFTQLLSAEDSAFISGQVGIEASGSINFFRDFRSGSLAP